MTNNSAPSLELRARVALEKYRFHKTHSLGQNFLLSESLINRLLDAAQLSPEDNVLEIGPGAGVMTGLMARRANRVLALELDRGLEPVLSQVLAGEENVQVVYADAMKADLKALTARAFGEGAPYRVVANLPYYITADILLRLTGAQTPPDSVTIMVQKEAAERIMSAPGSKQWCALAAELQYYGEARVLCEVGPEAFDPPPHVTSCFMRVDRHGAPVVEPHDPRLFRRLIRAAFAMRRKTLANNLKASFGLNADRAQAVLERAGVDPRARGESLTLLQLCLVCDALEAEL